MPAVTVIRFGIIATACGLALSLAPAVAGATSTPSQISFTFTGSVSGTLSAPNTPCSQHVVTGQGATFMLNGRLKGRRPPSGRPVCQRPTHVPRALRGTPRRRAGCSSSKTCARGITVAGTHRAADVVMGSGREIYVTFGVRFSRATNPAEVSSASDRGGVVTLLRPRTDPAPVDTGDAEALIREAATASGRRRWSIGLLVGRRGRGGHRLDCPLRVTHGPSTPSEAERSVTTVVNRHTSGPGLPEGPYANAHALARPARGRAPTGALYVADVTPSSRYWCASPTDASAWSRGDGTKGVVG